MQWADPVVLGRQIRQLDDSRFVELMNALISETAARHGIDRSCIATNLNIKEPDGGIDARCVNAPITAGRLIPAANVDYQFKAGSNKKSLSKIVAEDIKTKPRVLEGLKHQPFGPTTCRPKPKSMYIGRSISLCHRHF